MTPDTCEPLENKYNGENEGGVQVDPSTTFSRQPLNWRMVFGTALFVSGLMIFLDQGFHTGFIAILAPLVSGIVIVGAGVRDRKTGYLVGGSIVCGAGIGVLAFWMGVMGETPLRRMGIALFGLAFGFMLATILIWSVFRKMIWWPLIPSGIIGTIAAVFLVTPAGLLDFVLYLGVGTGMVFLAVGINKRMFGLIIPGCILIGVGPGIAVAWGGMKGISALARTGSMLVWFALGWGGITLVSRIVFQRFVWWPLIPGGILAMVGWGLYIGGNPGNAVNFIGNTGSIVMIIFGLYLLLMRRGIRR